MKNLDLFQIDDYNDGITIFTERGKMKIARNDYEYIIDMLSKKMDIIPIKAREIKFEIITYIYILDKFRLKFTYTIKRNHDSLLGWSNNFEQIGNCLLQIEKENGTIVFQSESLNFIDSIYGVISIYEYLPEYSKS